MGIERKKLKQKFRIILDSWKENASPAEYELICIGIYIILPVLAVLLILGFLFTKNHEEFRTIVLSAMALISLPLIIWRGSSLDRSSKAAEKQAENASKSHVADTYTKAIEQLGAVDNEGNPRLELRLGGLYALEKIAKANKDYHPQIMEVLCAYVRMYRSIDSQINPIEAEIKKEELYATYSSEVPIPPPSIDIQTCLAIIGRRQNSFDIDRLNLSEVNFCGTDLGEANLSQADFCRAEFIETVFTGAEFSEANFDNAEFFQAKLEGADLTGAKNLTCEQIESANIDRDTVFPDYIKVTWADDETYTCEMVEDSN
jgi:hypothetical protein